MAEVFASKLAAPITVSAGAAIARGAIAIEATEEATTSRNRPAGLEDGRMETSGLTRTM
ncbi:hypothetical protein D3C86_2254460 [compost metagenome]